MKKTHIPPKMALMMLSATPSWTRPGHMFLSAIRGMARRLGSGGQMKPMAARCGSRLKRT
jgi:hypothetical protein